jgi:hypothetical protein
MLESGRFDQRVSTGLGALDEVLEGLTFGAIAISQAEGAELGPRRAGILPYLALGGGLLVMLCGYVVFWVVK